MVTKDRVGAALAIVAAIVGLVLVFSTHHPEGDDDNARPGTSQVQELPGRDDDQPAAPGQPAAPAPARPAPGQPAPPAAGDGDGDGD